MDELGRGVKQYLQCENLRRIHHFATLRSARSVAIKASGCSAWLRTSSVQCCCFRSQHYEHILPASLRSTLATKLRPFLMVLARTQAVSSSKPGTSHVTSRLEHARVNLRAFDR